MNAPKPYEDTLDPDLRNRLLLYWSGELDESESSDMKVLLSENPALRTYLRELETMAAAVEHVQPQVQAPKHATTEALRRYAASEETSEEPLPDVETGVFFNWLKPLAAIAAIILICFATYQWMIKSNQSMTPVLTKQKAPASIEEDLAVSIVNVAPIKGMTRSSRLFSSQTRSNPSRLDVTRLKLNKLRTKIHKS